MRVRGHSLPAIGAAVDSGRLAFSYLQELFPSLDAISGRARRLGRRLPGAARDAPAAADRDAPRRGRLPHLEFELIGEVRLKGFTGATELFLARAAPE
jgi:hypothetical protein